MIRVEKREKMLDFVWEHPGRDFNYKVCALDKLPAAPGAASGTRYEEKTKTLKEF